MTKKIFNAQEWTQQYNIYAMTPADLLALIAILVDDTIDWPMGAGYYHKRLDTIGVPQGLCNKEAAPIDAAPGRKMGFLATSS